MLIALPNLDGTFTVTLFLPHRGEPSFASVDAERRRARSSSAISPTPCR